MALLENMRKEPVSRLALRSPVLVNEIGTLRDAISKMRDARLGCAIVVNDEQLPVGIFTEAMLRDLMADSALALEECVTSHMATTFPWVKSADPIETVLDAMETKNVRFVVVVDEEGRVAGLTGQKGLMEYVAEHFPGEVMVQRVGTEPYPGKREGA